MDDYIKIIDLFAGPGGLAEGFSSFKPENSSNGFEISLSVEKEFSAWKTLRLRAFTRQFKGEIPSEYYDYVAGRLGKSPEEKLFKIYPEEAAKASKEAIQFTLGEGSNEDLFESVRKQLGGSSETVLIGGPPCQAYSVAGRSRNKAKKGYEADKDHRHFLYKEYLKILTEFKPAVFVMENVKGILSSKTSKGLIFHEILDDLENAGYKIYSLVKPNDSDGRPDPHDFIIKAEQYGVPQARHRVIILGVRKDIKKKPETLLAGDPVTVGQAIGDLPCLRSGLSKHRGENSSKMWASIINKEIKPVLKQLRRNDVSAKISSVLKGIKGNSLSQGGKWVSRASSDHNMPDDLVEWYQDSKMDGICNHETRGHMDADLARYLFCSSYADVHKKIGVRMSPKLSDFPEALLPDHENVKSGKFVDRFKVQERDEPASTITCHISKDGHYFIHYDPAQCRSLTVREAARIQTFPDNYNFEGTRTEQYIQVGNAVPPLLANQIADIVHGILR